MNSRAVSAIVLLCSFLAACAGGVKPEAKGPPDWVNGDSSRYSTTLYLMGRGVDANLDLAKDRARADLAKSFEVAVSEDTRDVQTFKQQSGKVTPQQSSELDISRSVRTRTDALIRGIEIAAVWRDPTSQQHYVLAVLPRAQAAHGLRQDIQALDDATEAYVAQARTEGDLLFKIAAANKAVQAQRERAELQRMLRVADVSGHGIAPKRNLGELDNDLEKLLSRMSIAPQVGGGDSAQLDTSVRAALAGAGFRAAESSANYVLEANLNLNALGQREGWYWYTGQLDVMLRDADGRVRGSKRWLIKESSAIDVVARQRAIDKAADILHRELRSTLLSFAVKE